MTAVVTGLSHHTAAHPVLERFALTASQAAELLGLLARSPAAAEAVVLATCNRVEIYLETDRPDRALDETAHALGEVTGAPADDVRTLLYTHRGPDAVAHLFRVVSGLDSMALGESQIRGQVRAAYRLATDHGTAGPVLHDLFQHALRTGKRVEHTTGVGRAAADLVGVALDAATDLLGPRSDRPTVVVGAGALGSLTVAALRRGGYGRPGPDADPDASAPAECDGVAAGAGGPARDVPRGEAPGGAPAAAGTGPGPEPGEAAGHARAAEAVPESAGYAPPAGGGEGAGTTASSGAAGTAGGMRAARAAGTVRSSEITEAVENVGGVGADASGGACRDGAAVAADAVTPGEGEDAGTAANLRAAETVGTVRAAEAAGSAGAAGTGAPGGARAAGAAVTTEPVAPGEGEGAGTVANLRAAESVGTVRAAEAAGSAGAAGTGAPGGARAAGAAVTTEPVAPGEDEGAEAAANLRVTGTVGTVRAAEKAEIVEVAGATGTGAPGRACPDGGAMTTEAVVAPGEGEGAGTAANARVAGTAADMRAAGSAGTVQAAGGGGAVGTGASGSARADGAAVETEAVGAPEMGPVGGELVVVNRGREAAERLAARYGARAAGLDELPELLGRAALVVAATGAGRPVITAGLVAAARADGPRHPLVLVDLSLPRNVDPAVARQPGVRLVDLAGLEARLKEASARVPVDEARRIVAEETTAFLAGRHQATVAPLIVAMRNNVLSIAEAEVDRLLVRTPALADHVRGEVARTARRIAEKIVHRPTVRVREMAAQPDGHAYVAVVHDLFGGADQPAPPGPATGPAGRETP
ncbi:hypothetical protein ACSNOK_22755 [Streptomyces sp. URMC 126]|uniref:hypothetical protein n=1 Tax=Streptomyces sp. URMC 126 TaxID=3423401 RepID=UPI003F1B207E